MQILTKICRKSEPSLSFSYEKIVTEAVAYAENFHGGRFNRWHLVVIWFWCALFVKSQF